MSLTPQITLTVKLYDYQGNVIGSLSNPAYLRIALCGYGQTLPCVPGAGMVGGLGGEIPFVGSSLNVLLWGNDVITPAGTYYAISILDENRNVVQSGIYQFTGTQTIDLSDATQIVQPYPQPVPEGVYFADEISPNGTINSLDGVTGNATFTLPQAPSPVGSLNLFKNGQRMTRGKAFTLSGKDITYESGYVPVVGDSHICFYRYNV